MFVDGLIFPTGLQPWRDGVIVTLSGKIQFMADTNGDGQCDLRETWFEGFDEGNEQLRANHPVLGPDGIVYVAGGLRGGKIRSTDQRWQKGDRIVTVTKSDFAFDPRGGFFDAVAGASQYGLTIDDFGNRVGCSNRNPAIETLLGLTEIGGDRWSSPQDALHNIGKPAAESHVAAIAKSWTTSHTHAGQFSAACGVTVGLGTGTPADWKNNLVVCEPTSYAVQRQQIHENGIARESHRIDDPQELLSSRNDWFRPVDTMVGPDGSLFIVDMCRAVVEHPDWAPAELKQRPDERWGNDLGRIWRVSDASPNEQQNAESVTFQNSDGNELSLDDWMKRLDHPNPAIRQLATQWLAEQDNSKIEKALQQYWNDRDALSPAGFARLAQLLQRAGLLTDEMGREVAKHDSARVRRLAIRLLRDAEPDWQLLDGLLSDDDSGVRFDAVRLAGVWSQQADLAQVQSIAAKIAQVAHQDAGPGANQTYWMTRLGCLPARLSAAMTLELVGTDDPEKWNPSLVFRLCRAAAFGQAFCDEGLALESKNRGKPKNKGKVAPERAIVFAAAWTQGHQTAGRRPVKMLEQVRNENASELLQSAQVVADSMLSDQTQPVDIRLFAIDAMVGFEIEDWQRFTTLLREDSNDELHARLIPLLLARSVNDPAVKKTVSAWFDAAALSMTAELRSLAVSQMVRYPLWTNHLLDLVQQQHLPTTLLSIQQTQRMLKSKDAKIAKRAASLFQAARQDRVAVIEDYSVSISGSADLIKGQAHFRQHCAACHRIGDVGVQVGPDISDSRTKTPAYLLTAILDPNAAVDAGFLSHQILTVDGETLVGTMIANADSFVTLQVNGGERKTIDREDIDIIKPTGKSMMPEGFERSLTSDQMRDLVGYLKGWRYMEQGKKTLALESLSVQANR